LDHYDYFNVPSNPPKAEKADTQSTRKSKPVVDIENKDDNESRTSDTKKNTAIGIEVNTAPKINNPVESNLAANQKQEESDDGDFRDHGYEDLPPVEMKIHLQKVEMKDSNSQNISRTSPEKQDFQPNFPATQPITNKQSTQEPIKATQKNHSQEIKQTYPKQQPEELYLSEGDDMLSLNEKLLGFSRKTEHILYKLSECLHTSQISSIDKKIEMIKRLWASLSKNNQKVLNTLMKNQFGIFLSNFDIGFNEGGSSEGIQTEKISLKYVKPSIIERLYQEMDMLSCCIYLDKVWNLAPVTPVDNNIQWTISQFAPRHSGIKRNFNDRNIDQEDRSFDAYQTRRDQFSPSILESSKYAGYGAEINLSRNPSYSHSQGNSKDMQKFNGMHPSLNYASNNLNRENKGSYNDYYPNGLNEGASPYVPSGKYITPNLNPQTQQFSRLPEMYREGNRQLTGREQVSMRNSMHG